MSPGETQQQCRHQLVQWDTAIVATENMTQNTHLKILYTTGRSKNQKQYAIGCESIHIDVDDGQLTELKAHLRSVERYVTNSSRHRTGNLHGRPRHLSAESAKLNVMMLSVLGFSHPNQVIKVPGIGRNRFKRPQRRLRRRIWLR